MPPVYHVSKHALRSSEGWIYPTTPGIFETWLWKEQALDCRQAGCEVVVGGQGGWAWDRQTGDNRAWKALCEQVDGLEAVQGEVGIPNDAASHLYGLCLRAKSDSAHPWMAHWFSYTIMLLNRASYWASCH